MTALLNLIVVSLSSNLCRHLLSQPLLIVRVFADMNTSPEVLTSTGVLECVWQKTSTLSIAWPGLTSHRRTFSVWSSCPTGWVVSTDFIASSADRRASKCSGSLSSCLLAACHQRHFNFSNACISTQRRCLRDFSFPIGASRMMPVMNASLVNTSRGVLSLWSSLLCSASHFHSHSHFSIATTC